MAGHRRNPQRSREAILDAALEEFAAHGFAGARVQAIAQRAGLNKQLISHHFGGKHALYQAVMTERRSRGGGELVAAAATMPDALATFFDSARRDPEWLRVLLWEALEADNETGAAGVEARRSRYLERVAWVEAEQTAGRLPAGLDPGLLLLTLFGAILYPLLLPDVTEILTGLRPDTDEFADAYRDHLAAFAENLVPHGLRAD